LLEDHPGPSIRLGGEFFARRTTEEFVFYDWIADKTTAIQALEIHLPPDDSLLKTRLPFSQISYIDTQCFVQIWFTANRDGTPMGKEAFGDILFFEANDGRLAVVVGIEDWLSPSERQQLLSDFGLVST